MHFIVHSSKNDPMPTTYVKINEEPFRTRAMRGYALGTWNWRDEPLLGKAVTHAQNVLFFWQPHTKRQYNKLAIKHNFVVYPGNTIFICASWPYTTIHTILRAWYHIISKMYNIYKIKTTFFIWTAEISWKLDLLCI